MLTRFVACNKNTGDVIGIFHVLRLLDDCDDFCGEDADAMSEAECALNRCLPIPPYCKWNGVHSSAWFTEEGVVLFGDKLSVLADMVDWYLYKCGYSSKKIVAEDNYDEADVLYRDRWQVIVRCA